MKCNICGVKEATVHLTEVVNDNVTKLHLCEQCAKTKSDEMQSHFGLTDLLAGLMDFGPAVPNEELREDIKLKCPGCGMTHGFVAMGHGCVAEAWGANPFSPFLFAAACIYAMWFGGRSAGLRVRKPRIPGRLVVGFCILLGVLVLAWWCGGRPR